MISLIENYFSHPIINSQLEVCPIPFKYDTYGGCLNGCKYCFARQLISFHRRKSDHPTFEYLKGSDTAKFSKWMSASVESIDNLSEHVAVRERIPLKIGAMSDPFPNIESTELITFNTLKILDEYDYPVVLLTKNPVVLSNYINKFDNPNWSIGVSLISTDDKFVRQLEPNAPLPSERLNAIQSIADAGYKVMVKIQPAIYPRILSDLPDLVGKISDCGAWAFNTEGLKIRPGMFDQEKIYFDQLNKSIGYDVLEYYKRCGVFKSPNLMMSYTKKMEYISLSMKLAKQHNLKYFCADNYMGKVGDGCECCGTEILRDYRIWGNNNRVKVFGGSTKSSSVLGTSILKTVSFNRSSKKFVTMNSFADNNSVLTDFF